MSVVFWLFKASALEEPDGSIVYIFSSISRSSSV